MRIILLLAGLLALSALGAPARAQGDAELQRALATLEAMRGQPGLDVDAAKQALIESWKRRQWMPERAPSLSELRVQAERGGARDVATPPPPRAADVTPRRGGNDPERYLTQKELTALLQKATKEEIDELRQLSGMAQERRKWELAEKYGVIDKGYKVERLPVTPTDQMALDAFGRMSSVWRVQDLVLQDAGKAILDHAARFRAAGESGYSPVFGGGRKQYIVINGGPPAKKLYEALAAYHRAQGDAGKTLSGTAPNGSPWFGVPGSHLYVYRMPGGDGSNPLDYVALGSSPRVFRPSDYALHEVRSPNVTMNFSIAKDFAADIIEVVEAARVDGVTIRRDWSQYSHQLSIVAPKLYGAQPVRR